MSAWGLLSDPEQPPWKRPQPMLGPGPEPTGYDKVFDAVYGWLGGTPDKRWAATKTAERHGVGLMQ